jgi:tRNA G18 (ribose-2'-O)-methylase SpoU
MGKQRRKRDTVEQVRWLFRRHKNANMLATPGVHEFIIVLDQVKSDFNIGKIFRSADAFGAREVHLVGIECFNPTAATGSFKWVPARFHSDFRHVYEELSGRGYTLFMLEPQAAQSLAEASLPVKSAFIFGHEEYGIQLDRAAYRDVRALSIAQFGRVQSLNVSIAAAIVMYEYVRQHRLRQPSPGHSDAD